MVEVWTMVCIIVCLELTNTVGTSHYLTASFFFANLPGIWYVIICSVLLPYPRESVAHRTDIPRCSSRRKTKQKVRELG